MKTMQLRENNTTKSEKLKVSQPRESLNSDLEDCKVREPPGRFHAGLPEATPSDSEPRWCHLSCGLTWGQPVSHLALSQQSLLRGDHTVYRGLPQSLEVEVTGGVLGGR